MRTIALYIWKILTYICLGFKKYIFDLIEISLLKPEFILSIRIYVYCKVDIIMFFGV
jgi:hypothetical protein